MDYENPELDKSAALVNQDTEVETVEVLEDTELELATDSDAKQVKKTLSVVLAIKQLLNRWTVWCLILNAGLWYFSVGSLVIFINDYMVKQVGLTEGEAALGVTIMGGASWIGAISIIATSKLRFERLIPYIVDTSIFGICAIAMAFSNGQAMFYGLAVLYGIGMGAHIASILAVCHDFCGTELLSMLFGIFLFGEGLAGLTTSPICSYLESNVHPVAGLCFSGATGIAASLTLIPVLVKKILANRKAEQNSVKVSAAIGLVEGTS